jgi:hypothetical protein
MVTAITTSTTKISSTLNFGTVELVEADTVGPGDAIATKESDITETDSVKKLATNISPFSALVCPFIGVKW